MIYMTRQQIGKKLSCTRRGLSRLVLRAEKIGTKLGLLSGRVSERDCIGVWVCIHRVVSVRQTGSMSHPRVVESQAPYSSITVFLFISLIILQLILLTLSLWLGAHGNVVYSEYSFLTEPGHRVVEHPAPNIMLAAAAFIIIGVIVGGVGYHRGSIIALMVYAGLLLLLAILYVSALSLAFKDVHGHAVLLPQETKAAMSSYQESANVRGKLNKIQSTHMCCGVTSADDYGFFFNATRNCTECSKNINASATKFSETGFCLDNRFQTETSQKYQLVPVSCCPKINGSFNCSKSSSAAGDDGGCVSTSDVIPGCGIYMEERRTDVSFSIGVVSVLAAVIQLGGLPVIRNVIIAMR